MDSAIVFTFTRAVPGREAKALDVFTETQAFFATKAHEEKCGDPINFIGPSGTGLLIVPGEYEELFHLVREDDFLHLYTKALFAVPDIRYEIGAFAEGVQESMARWSKVGAELALI